MKVTGKSKANSRLSITLSARPANAQSNTAANANSTSAGMALECDVQITPDGFLDVSVRSIGLFAPLYSILADARCVKACSTRLYLFQACIHCSFIDTTLRITRFDEAKMKGK